MRLERHLNLLSLPVLPHDHDGAAGTEYVHDAYKEELARLKNSQELRAFIKRWRSLWLLRVGWVFGRNNHPLHSKKLIYGEQFLLAGNYDAKKVLWYLSHREALDKHLGERDASVAVNLIMPFPLVESFLLANKYGVGTDLGLIRLYLDTYGIRLR